MKIELTIRVEWSQFYLKRAGDQSRDIVPPDRRTGFVTEGGLGTVVTGSLNGNVNLGIEMLEAKPDEPTQDWGHVTEGSLGAAGPLHFIPYVGSRLITLPYDDAAVRLRVHWKNHIRPFVVDPDYSDDDVDGGPPNDREILLIQLWTEDQVHPVEVIRDSYS